MVKTFNKAFTLIEVLVSLTLFSVVMLVGMGALLTIIDANSKAQATQSVMNNLNIAIDGMMRSVRMGTGYRCGAIVGGVPNDCPNAEHSITFITQNGNMRTYFLQDGRIMRRACNNGTSDCYTLAITAPDIEISRFDVFVAGAAESYTANKDILQPTAVFVIEGVAHSDNVSSSLYARKKKLKTEFKIQTVATQRILDL